MLLKLNNYKPKEGKLKMTRTLTELKPQLKFARNYADSTNGDNFVQTTLNTAYGKHRKANPKDNTNKNYPIDLGTLQHLMQNVTLPRKYHTDVDHYDINNNDKIYVVDIIEAIWVLTNKGVDSQHIVFVTNETWKKKYAEDYLLVDSDNIMSYNDYMNVVNPNASGLTIINPAWGLSKEALAQAMKITKGPVAILADAKLADDSGFDWSRVDYFKYLGHEAFDVKLNSIFALFGEPSEFTVMEDQNGAQISVKSESILVPMVGTTQGWKLANSFVAKGLPGLGKHMSSGSMHRGTIDKVKTSLSSTWGVLCKPTVTLAEVKVPQSYKDQLAGFGTWKVAFGADNDVGKIGPIVVLGPDVGCPNRVHFISCSSKSGAQKMQTYLQSPEVCELVKQVSTTAKNSKSLFNLIPEPKYQGELKKWFNK